MSVEKLRIDKDPVVTMEATDGELGTGIVEAVATATNARPEDLPPLFETVDIDALNTLFTQDRTGMVAFDYCGFHVCVRADGQISVHERD